MFLHLSPELLGAPLARPLGGSSADDLVVLMHQAANTSSRGGRREEGAQQLSTKSWEPDQDLGFPRSSLITH